MQQTLTDLLLYAHEAAVAACTVINDVYTNGEFDTILKEDRSPLTLADKGAHESITQVLQTTGLPMLSEEGSETSYEIRKTWKHFWLIDPLDGTKEFIKRNGEFTVNIALIENGTPVLGVVAVPVTGEVYYGARGMGAWVVRDGVKTQLAQRSPVDVTQEGIRVVASRSHLNEQTSAFIQSLKNPSLVSAGSSLKFMLLASGQADIYPRFAPTMEWDTAAAHAIVNQVGLRVQQAGKKDELIYNKKDLLNPGFICY